MESERKDNKTKLNQMLTNQEESNRENEPWDKSYKIT